MSVLTEELKAQLQQLQSNPLSGPVTGEAVAERINSIVSVIFKLGTNQITQLGDGGNVEQVISKLMQRVTEI